MYTPLPLLARNDALNSNPPNADINLSVHGSDFLWAVFCIFAVSWLGMVILDFSRPRGTRLFHQIAIIILTTASIAYFSMASDLGAAPVAVEFRKQGDAPTRQVWFVRYIMWFISFPLLLLELLLATGLSLSDIFTTIFMGIVFVVSGLVGSLVPSTYKWGYFTIGIAALFYIWYVLLWHAPRTAFGAGSVLRSGHLRSAGYLSFLLILYPIAWACSEGGNVIKPTSEMIFYAILDLLAGPVFLYFFLWHLRGIDYATFGFESGKFSAAQQAQTNTPVREKTAPAATSAAATSTAAPASMPATAPATAPTQTV